MPPKDATGADQIVGARIAQLRNAKGLSQTAVGDAVGVTYQQIQKYEMGQNRVGAGRLQRIAKFLDVPVAMLFSDETEAAFQVDTLDILNLPGAVELLKAYGEIQNRQVRRDVLTLVRTIARTGAQPGTEDA
jgi:transcriptional regulator with XRE-family HTH domain